MAKNKEMARKKAARAEARKERRSAAKGPVDQRQAATRALIAKLGPGVRVETGAQKMSPILEEFAGPLLDAAPGKTERQAALRFAGLAWNVAVGRELGQPDDDALFRDDPEAAAMIETFVERKLALFPGNHRLIVDVVFKDRPGGGFDCGVASTLLEDEDSAE